MTQKPVNSFEQIQQTYNSLPSEWVIKPSQFGHIENHLNYGNINSSKQFSINFMGGYGRNPNRVSVRIKNCVTKEVTFLQTTLDFKNDCNPILNMDDWVAIHLLELMEGSQ